ncbi:MAG: fumarate reductase flavoprotein subunit [Desulfarculaceae bacterium]|nr:fumarate reductase flavoprotein subunit [Desulfarculaceae bacterium]MCF8047650.1 fumarate reductase flavoprotein subunit [Desulfarculaceae bacterium]MCF8063721.1 fumarate reductase flavoprotein subunit [Desulfarculaceae bacterium]MCF8097050.1 fumarate reductase flavoprotein subunit [Desulfarculaceae bacterium]MCF8121581.1 fumarate reductase flavoprotein subunit [Desulfarculaceae bacterium]
MEHETFYTDLLCVGAGLAGERVAISAAAAGFDAILLSLVPARRSHSCAAEGGMQAALGNCAMGEGDSPDVHFADTVKGSDWGCDQECARIFADTAPIAVREAANWGMPWNRVVAGKAKYWKGGEEFEAEEKKDKHGLITARAFGGTAKWRTCYTADGTGHTLLYTLDNKVTQLGVRVHDRVEAVSLIHDGENCIGCVARDLKTGKLRVYLAKATLIATGGYGRLYSETTNTVINEGGGHIIAQDTGLVPFGNPEAVQFHPTGVVPTNILVTEGCRGDGGTLLDVDEKRFMDIYEPAKAELASRDVVSRWMMYHIAQGKGVPSPYGDHLWLDIRHLGAKHITTKLREVYDLCRHFLGVNPINQLIPVRPAQHYSMGGVRTNSDGAAYGLKGLFSCGESACWDMHGFNRLGGNSLAETIVAGRHVGMKVVEFLEGAEVTLNSRLADEGVVKETERIERLVNRTDGAENVYAIKDAMQLVMMEKVGIFRNGADLQAAVDSLREIYAKAKKIGLRSSGIGANPELSLALKMPGMVRLAICVAYGALMRTESRGCHARDDYQARNDRDWLNRTLAYWPDLDADLPDLRYEPSTKVMYMPPGDRGYGKTEIIPMDSPKED